MTNHIEAVRRLARSVTERTASDIGFALFRLYLAAAGGTQRSSWIYIPGRATPLKGWKAAAGYVAALPDTSVFLSTMAAALGIGEREIGERAPEPSPLGQNLAAAADPLPEYYAARMAATLKQLALANGVPLALLAPSRAGLPAKGVTVGDDVDLSDLAEAQEYIAKRIVKRAAYDTGKALLDVLDGWIEGARENHVVSGDRDAFDERFYVSDIRGMINDAMRLMGAPAHRLPQDGE